ncbi:unnamed protein product [Triticum turgidum subsp. durum]|uniref:Rx N-terminal domain-containing protein n=1 Tax=Triticum turgidum subsp. durum TaxID=4567 RepID=A0A9R0R8R6_TRITD|nr:unnamed protein product [Triticum turgidum subsp. durum]
MEVAISAVTSELVSRFISFLMNKYQSHSHTQLEEEKLAEKLQHLLIRVGTVVEEADRRCIANSGMLMQLKMLSEAMYRGHHVLDAFNVQQLLESSIIDEVSDSSSVSYLSFPFKRPRRTASKEKDRSIHPDLHGALKSLEIVVANMAEFVVFLGGYVVEEDWAKFYSFLRRMSKGSKVIIISKLQRIARFGTVKPICLSHLSYEEFWYLFKTLTFGSADPSEHPQLVRIAEEFAKIFQAGGSFVTTNAFADVFRRNLDVQFWLCVLGKTKRVIQKNLSEHGVYPYLLFEQGHPVDITDFALHPSSAVRITNCTNSSNRLTNNDLLKKETVTLGELLVNPNNRPKGEFSLLAWESRIPPYTRFEHFVASSVQDLPQSVNLSGRKKRRVPI